MGRYFILSLGVTWSVIFLSESQLLCPCEVTGFSNRESWTWGSWITEADGACDCASNIRRRSRRCHQIRNNGFQIVQTLSCPKSDICSDVNSCAATWSRWETVERCSALCGQPGIVIQRRRCFTHQNRASRQCNPETQEDTQIRNEPCHGPPCPSTTASPETTSVITTMFTTANPTSRSLVITGSSTNLTKLAIAQDTKGITSTSTSGIGDHQGNNGNGQIDTTLLAATLGSVGLVCLTLLVILIILIRKKRSKKNSENLRESSDLSSLPPSQAKRNNYEEVAPALPVREASLQGPQVVPNALYEPFVEDEPNGSAIPSTSVYMQPLENPPGKDKQENIYFTVSN